MPFLTSGPLSPAFPALSPFSPAVPFWAHLGCLKVGKLLYPMGVTFSPYHPRDLLRAHQIPPLLVLISVGSALAGQRHWL